MSSYRTLVFKELHPGKTWIAGSDIATVIVRQVHDGYVAFLQSWSENSQSYTVDPITPEPPRIYFPTRTEAENACQRRYEQELRWTHSRR